MTALRIAARVFLAVLVLAVALCGGNAGFAAWQAATWDDDD